MRSIVCTQFEGDYHYGAAALINSLYKAGFRGELYAGYKGELPYWASKSKESTILDDTNHTLQVAEGLQVNFIKIKSSSHLTNYKPDFMKLILDGPGRNAEGIYYFDSDIVVRAPWSYFETWVEYGIAVCEDLNSPIPKDHPLRRGWRDFFKNAGINLNFKDATYVNGGFVGLRREDFDFIDVWIKIQNAMSTVIGGLENSQFNKMSTVSPYLKRPYGIFSKTDQDALNASIETWEKCVSFIGLEGMGFKSGVSLMSHALGPIKPWSAKPIRRALSGHSPRQVDRDYLMVSQFPIRLYSRTTVVIRYYKILLATFISRFYSKPR
ncbi:MAG TPA: hypothetical protein VF602_09655 [Pedobacter sp.]